MDLITDLPISWGFDSILVVVDHSLMKGVILLPCNKTITAEQVAELLLEHLYKQFGLSNEFISDRGPQFAAHAFQELLKLLNVTSKSPFSCSFAQETSANFEKEIKPLLHVIEWLSRCHIFHLLSLSQIVKIQQKVHTGLSHFAL